ncbi:hypothetical protein ACFQ9Z_15570 [Streptomyces sp. NPDC056580]|uniref:hypothetical protein n=1 Tax=Streptomyces sp. NPDC056580 TaxID=3345872 RepID=UPI0036C94F99
MAGDLASTVAMATAPLLYLTGHLSFGLLLGLLAVVGAADGPANGAKGLFVPVATRAARVLLERGTGLSAAVERAATTIGPAVAGQQPRARADTVPSGRGEDGRLRSGHAPDRGAPNSAPYGRSS